MPLSPQLEVGLSWIETVVLVCKMLESMLCKDQPNVLQPDQPGVGTPMVTSGSSSQGLLYPGSSVTGHCCPSPGYSKPTGSPVWATELCCPCKHWCSIMVLGSNPLSLVGRHLLLSDCFTFSSWAPTLHRPWGKSLSGFCGSLSFLRGLG